MVKETMAEIFDAVIIGGRVAGALTAAFLAQAGHCVLVLERARFPSDTISTHFFRAPTFRAFQKAGILDQVLAAAPRLTVNYNVIDGIVFPEPVDEPADFPFYMCLRRIVLDAILYEAVRRLPNVDFRIGARAREILFDSGRAAGVVWTEDGQQQQADSRLLIGADGVRSFVARQVRPEVQHSDPIRRVMYYAYYRNMSHQDGPAAEFHYAGNTLAYVMPIDSGLTMLAVSAPIETFRAFKKDPEGRLVAELTGMPEIAPRLGGIQRQGPVRGSGSIPGYVRVPFGPGWVLAGDAGMVMDPWSGQGIDHAAVQAGHLAHQADLYLKGESSWEAAMGAYHRDRDAALLKSYRQTSILAADLRPMTRSALEKRGLR